MVNVVKLSLNEITKIQISSFNETTIDVQIRSSVTVLDYVCDWKLP